MIDPMISLALAVHSNKGAYALLLGSGISRAAGIPTGWEVVLDLIRKVAKLESENCEPDPENWFRKKYKAQPDYSQILNELAKTPAERQKLLLSYFEPTDEDRSKGLKVPTAAHKSIAKLVESGFLRVILTTNFDRLIEVALEGIEIRPTVISSYDDIEGVMPLVHSGTTVIKLNGDYRDTRIKNTESELASYDTGLNTLLDQVLDEYGLIVCGWSGEWDAALRNAMERCRSQRFSTFWATKSPLAKKGKALAEHRHAEVLMIEDANQFFESLRQKVEALVNLPTPQPLSAKMAAATVKQLLADTSARIRLDEFVTEETERAYSNFGLEQFPIDRPNPSHIEITRRGRLYEAHLEVLLSIIAICSYWGYSQHDNLCIRMIERIGNPPSPTNGTYYTNLMQLRYYPALLLVYASGISAILGNRYDLLGQILQLPKFFDHSSDIPLVLKFEWPTVTFKTSGDGLSRGEWLPFHILAFLKEKLRNILPYSQWFEIAFHRFEYFLALAMVDISNGNRYHAGVFHFQNDKQSANSIQSIVTHELRERGAQCPYLTSGLFNNDPFVLGKRIEQLNNLLSNVPTHSFL